jgi:hypothetical protein
MGDVGERAAVHQHWAVLQRLHKVGLDRFAQKRRHRAGRLKIGGGDGRSISPPRHHDTGEPRLQVGEVLRQAEDRHDLRGDRDIKAGLPRGAVLPLA